MASRDGEWVRTTLATMKGVAANWHGNWIQVNDTIAHRAQVCPAQAVGGEWPGWSSVLAARQVGLAAVKTGESNARNAVKTAVANLLGDADGSREFQRVQDWIVGLSRPARLDVADEALRWLVAWRSVAPTIASSAVVDAGAVRAKVTTDVVLRASVDAVTRNPAEVDSTAYVSVGGATSTLDDRDTAARLAAVLWLAGTSVNRVVVLAPKSRQSRSVEVDVHLVSLGAEQFLSALRVLINHESGVEEAPALPGTQCRWCDQRATCLEGRQFLASQPESSGGLPVRL